MNMGDFNEAERQVVDAVERFVEREVTPHVDRLERSGTYPEALVRGMANLGLFGLAVPEDFGGLGLRMPVFSAVMETVAAGWTTLAAYINSHATVAYLIATHGTTQQKSRYLPGLASGIQRGALCLTEPGAGSDLQGISACAVTRDQQVTLNGNKVFVTNGARATLYAVLARTGSDAGTGRARHGLLLVERTLPGVTVGSEFEKMAFGLVDTVELLFSDVQLSPAAFVGGQPEKGMAQLLDSLETGRVAIASSCVGLAAAALRDAMRYSGERKTFGVTIDQHQAVQLKLAEMATKLVASRLMTRQAAAAKQVGERSDMISAMAKLYASEACLEIVLDAFRIHGGYGYIRDFHVERMVREAHLYITGEGTNDINRLVIARRLREGSETATLGLPQ